MNVSQPYGDSQLASTLALIGGTALGDTRNTLIKQAIVATANKTGGTPGGSGDVVGPASSTANHIAVFASGTGKLLADSGITVLPAAVGFTIAGGTSSKTLTVLNTGTAALLEIAQTFTAANIFSVNGAASTPAMSLTGSAFTGGTGTTTKPLFLVEPTGTTSAGWGTYGTMIGVNARAGFANGSLIDLQVAGTSYFKVLPDTLAAGAVEIYLSGHRLVMYNGCFNPNFSTIALGDSFDASRQWNGLVIKSAAQVIWGSDTGLARSGAGAVKVTNGISGGYGSIDASAYKVGGAAGIDFSGAITNITVVKGIVTAAS